MSADAAGAATTTGRATAAGPTTVAAHRRTLLPWVKPDYTAPLVLREGQGVWVRDDQGQASFSRSSWRR